MTPRLHLDFETRSEADLETVGAIAYAMHPSTHVMCMGFAIDDAPVTVFTGKQIRNGVILGPWSMPHSVVVAHNAPFEDAIWEYVMHRKYGYAPIRDPRRWDCTMARALMVGLPAKLEDVARVLELPFQKDLDGRRATILLSRPAGHDALGDPIWNNDPALVAKMLKYNPIDVEVSRAADKVLPQMGPHERAIWEHTLEMNRRGVAVDVDLAAKAARVAQVLTTDLNGALRDLTGGFIDKATQLTRMKAWLVMQGLPEFGPSRVADNGDEVDGESLDKAAMLALLERPNLPPLVRQVVQIRQQVGKSSTAKYVKTVETACPTDNRVRGVLQYHAAHTGRDGGRLIQPQNYPKGWMGPDAAADQARCVDAIKADDPWMFDVQYGVKAMDALSNTLRGTIVAGPKKMLVSADYVSIELCVEMWLAGDEATLAMLRRGEKPYVDMARAIYPGLAVTKETHPKEYDLGKRVVLGAGYRMGAPRFKVTCKLEANLDITDELAERAIKAYRAKYPLVVAMWSEVERAAIAAVKNPGQAYASCTGKILWGMSRDRRFLVAKLPSGRYLWYWKPAVRIVKTPWGEDRETLCYWGKHSKTKQWVLIPAHGGVLVENVTQAVARDLMMHGSLAVEKAGFAMVLRVHDELLAEIGTPGWMEVGEEEALKQFLKVMCDTPAWAKGCPVSAEGWIGPRYRK